MIEDFATKLSIMIYQAEVWLYINITKLDVWSAKNNKIVLFTRCTHSEGILIPKEINLPHILVICEQFCHLQPNFLWWDVSETLDCYHQGHRKGSTP